MLLPQFSDPLDLGNISVIIACKHRLNNHGLSTENARKDVLVEDRRRRSYRARRGERCEPHSLLVFMGVAEPGLLHLGGEEAEGEDDFGEGTRRARSVLAHRGQEEVEKDVREAVPGPSSRLVRRGGGAVCSWLTPR